MKPYEKCKIYLQMAKTTGSETRKSRYLDMAEILMNEDEVEEGSEFSKEIDDTVKDYVENNEISRRPVADVYMDYFDQCREMGWIPVSRTSFTRQLRVGYQMKSVPRKNKTKKAVRIFVPA